MKRDNVLDSNTEEIAQNIAQRDKRIFKERTVEKYRRQIENLQHIHDEFQKKTM